ncbi:MAG: ATP-binding protein [Thermodesulfovibrionales bacterium]
MITSDNTETSKTAARETNSITLEFLDKALENDFAADYFDKIIKRLRYSIVLGFILYGLFGILDSWIIPEAKHQAWIIRFAIVCPYLAFLMLFTYTPYFRKIMQPVVAITMLVCGFGLILMISFAGPFGGSLYYSGLILVIMFTFTLVYLRFIYAVSVSMVLLIFYNIVAIVKGHIPLPILINNNFFFISANIVGMLAGYSTEQYFRRNFLQTRVIKDNANKLEDEITRHKETHQESVKSLSLLKATVESTADGILVVDTKGKVTLYNPTFLALWKIPESLMALHDDNRLIEYVLDQLKEPDSFIDLVRSLYNNPGIESSDILEFKDGRVYERYSKPQKIDDTIVGRVWCFKDITDRKRFEAELIEYRDHLEELVGTRTEELSVLNNQLRQSQKMEAIGILAGGVAHEFSNILSTIKGSAYIIQKKLQKDDSLNKYADQITASINKASDLAHGLLAFSRKQIIDLKPHRINEIVVRVKNLIARLIGEHIELSVELTARDLTIIADSNQMEQVLINLVTNAIDAMQKGGRLTIRTDLAEMTEDFIKEHGFGVPGHYALVRVTDTGTGMNERTKERIFEPFFTTKEVGKGTGLGLSIAYGLVKQHNGYIDLDTRPGEGTTFSIYIPIAEQEAEEASIQDSPSVTGGRETILFAEDEADTRKIMTEVLRFEGYTVLEAADGEEAIRIFRENRERIDLALLDVRMPKKDGKEVYAELKKIRPGIRSLFMSGYTAEVIDNSDFREKGLNFISKASTPEEILAKIRTVLDGPGL